MNQVFTVFFTDSANLEATDVRRHLSLSSLKTRRPPSVALREKRRSNISKLSLFVSQTKFQGVYTNTVVVQHHPVIQRKGDRAVQLFCFFETGDKLVTNSYDVLAE